MNTKTTFKTALVYAIALTCVGAGWTASLKHGKVRARERTWIADKRVESTGDSRDVEEQSARSEEAFDSVAIYNEPVEETYEAGSEPQFEGASPEKAKRRSIKRRGKLILIGGTKKKGPNILDGYLAVGAAPMLRFSDIDPVNARPPSPALPEFNFVSSEYIPYLIEEALPEDAMNDNSMLAELVIEMEPHTVVSGTIDTRRHKQEEQVEHFQLEEQRTTVLRPEEVLIFFETDSNSGNPGAIVPFSPATPNATTIKSSATLKKE